MNGVSVDFELVTCINFSKDSTKVLIGSKSGEIAAYDTENSTILSSIKIHANYVSSVGFIDNINLAYSSSYDKTIKLWEPSSEKKFTRSLIMS